MNPKGKGGTEKIFRQSLDNVLEAALGVQTGNRQEWGWGWGWGWGERARTQGAGTWITITLEPGLVPGKPRALHDQVKESEWGLGNKGGEGGGSESHAKVPKAPDQ